MTAPRRALSQLFRVLALSYALVAAVLALGMGHSWIQVVEQTGMFGCGWLVLYVIAEFGKVYEARVLLLLAMYGVVIPLFVVGVLGLFMELEIYSAVSVHPTIAGLAAAGGIGGGGPALVSRDFKGRD